MRPGPKPRHPEQVPNCAAIGCARKAICRGFCDSHSRRHRAGLPVDVPLRIARYEGPCSFDGCDKRPVSGGLCSGHWQQSQRGEPLSPLREIKRSNRIEIEGLTAWVVLTDNDAMEVARSAVDVADVTLIIGHRWRAKRGGKKGAKTYAHSHTGGFMHGLIMAPTPGMEPDHINRDTLDNRRANLRNVTHSVNCQNMGSSGRSGRELPRNVYKNANGYRVQAALHGHVVYGGTFPTIPEAEAAAVALRRRLHGDNAAPPG